MHIGCPGVRAIVPSVGRTLLSSLCSRSPLDRNIGTQSVTKRSSIERVRRVEASCDPIPPGNLLSTRPNPSECEILSWDRVIASFNNKYRKAVRRSSKFSGNASGSPVVESSRSNFLGHPISGTERDSGRYGGRWRMVRAEREKEGARMEKREP